MSHGAKIAKSFTSISSVILWSHSLVVRALIATCGMSMGKFGV